ncbi:MAG: hypothetical protein LBI70_03655 [Rickettsiales bacterium]|jgi:hypothetical protein|nr:hypothetical protein [Rickettsiales bacterium]
MVMIFSEFEQKLMRMFLRGNHPMLELLRKQYVITKKAIEPTIRGFYLYFDVHDKLLAIAENVLLIDDIIIGNNNYGAGFILFIKDGFLCYLEGYTCSDRNYNEIIKDYGILDLHYSGGDRREIDIMLGDGTLKNGYRKETLFIDLC